MIGQTLRQSPAAQAEFYRDFYSLSGDARAHLEEFGLLDRIDVGGYLKRPLTVPAETPIDAVECLEADPRTDFQFALVCDARFVKPTFATMLSVISQLDGKGSMRFVVLGDGLEQHHRAHLMSLNHIHGRKVEVRVEDITRSLDRDVGTGDPKRATFGRIYLVDYLPPQRTVYLDGDILATRDLSELFDLDLGDACLAGVPDSAALRLLADPSSVPLEQRTRLVGITKGDPLQYLNGGLLILDLDNPDFLELALRARSLVVEFGKALKQRDQDALNIAFAGRKYLLDGRYNYMTQFFTSDRCLDEDLLRRKYEAADATIIHFSGKVKPWKEGESEFYNGLYRKLVNQAEDAVGTTCGFYFSRAPVERPADWSRAEWAAALGASGVATSPEDAGADADVELIDICDDRVFLRMSPAMLALAHANGLRFVAATATDVFLEVPLDPEDATPATIDGLQGIAVSFPIDLSAALAGIGPAAHDVEYYLAASSPDDTHFRRTLKAVRLLRAGGAELLRPLLTLGTIGAVDALRNEALWGWVRSPLAGQRESLTLYADGRLVAIAVADEIRKSLPADGHHFAFRFDLARIPEIGRHTRVELDVRVPGTNLSLRHSPLTAQGYAHALRYHKPDDAWLPQA